MEVYFSSSLNHKMTIRHPVVTLLTSKNNNNTNQRTNNINDTSAWLDYGVPTRISPI